MNSYQSHECGMKYWCCSLLRIGKFTNVFCRCAYQFAPSRCLNPLYPSPHHHMPHPRACPTCFFRASDDILYAMLFTRLCLRGGREAWAVAWR